MNRWYGLLMATVMVIGLGAACTKKSSNILETTVTAQGGTYKLGSMVVEVPPNAVTGDTKLTATKPAVIPKGEGLFADNRHSGLRFDLHLANGQQPNTPLKVSIPLDGAFLPQGAKRDDALLFTRTRNDQHFVLVPSELDDKGVLHAELSHLSEKDVLYLTPEKLTEMAKSGAISLLPSPGCPSWIEVPGRFNLNANPDPARIEGCLQPRGADPFLSAINKTSYMWSVSASQPGTVIEDTVDDFEQQGVEQVAKIFPQNFGKSFLAPGGYVYTKLDSAKMPNKVTFSAEAVNYYAEIIWMVVTFVVEVSTGKKPHEALETINAILTAADVQSCLKDLFGKSDSFPANIFDNIFTTCGEFMFWVVIKYVGEDAADVKKLHKFFGKKFFTVGGLFKNGLDQVLNGIEGIKQNIKGSTITIGVVSGDCLNKTEINENVAIFLNQAGQSGKFYKVVARQPFKVLCEGGWLAIDIDAYHTKEWWDMGYAYNFGHLLLRWSKGEWRGVSYTPLPFDCGDEPCPKPVPTNPAECGKAPQKLRVFVEC